MVLTVTITTVSTITSTAGFAGSLALIAVLALASVLVAKEFSTATNAPRLQRFGRGLNVAIIPLLMVFAGVVAAKLVEIL
jgi:hypothetical protein